MMNIRQTKTLPKRRTNRKLKKLCKNCRERPARFAVRRKRTDKKLGRIGFVKTGGGHDLCQKCYRSLYESSRSLIRKFPFF